VVSDRAYIISKDESEVKFTYAVRMEVKEPPITANTTQSRS
jgi:hypothetical protein